MIKCEICGRELKTIDGLPKHVRIHKISIKEYYLKYLGKKGSCRKCGKDTTFSSVDKGYRQFCSKNCSYFFRSMRNKKKYVYNFKCEICGKDFEKLRGLSKHISIKHRNQITNEEYYLKYIGKIGKCKQCGKDTLFVNMTNGYRQFCSYKCSANNNEVKHKSKQTCLNKYGFEYASKSDEYKNNKKERLIRNNGISPYKLTYKKCLERYPMLVKVEELKEGPNGEILAHCKNVNCKNSKENGGYFEPTIYQLNWRKCGIDKNDTYYFYCCEECKHSCPLYHKSATELHNLINENSKKPYTQAEYSTWKKEIYHRQRIENNTENNFCEYCNSTENLQVHHIHPQKLEPGYSLDPDNGIITCEDCHYKYGHANGTECSTGNLANKICK